MSMVVLLLCVWRACSLRRALAVGALVGARAQRRRSPVPVSLLYTAPTAGENGSID